MHDVRNSHGGDRISVYVFVALVPLFFASLTHGQLTSPAPINFADQFGRTQSNVDYVHVWNVASNDSAKNNAPNSSLATSTQHAIGSESQSVDELAALISRQAKIRSIIPKIMPCVVSVEEGSGVIVTSSGVILTASHVTRKSGRIVNVRFSDGRVVSATTLGTNYNTDTAALRLNSPGPWPHISITDSSVIRPGDWCLALGYPFSFPRGKPAAIRMGRVINVDGSQIVTDCPIMGGDSGGPLLNLNGNLIGVSSRVKSDIDKNVHIPVQLFLDDWKKIAASEDVRVRTNPTGHRVYLGIQGETDLDRVRIRRVHQGSPAELAGLMADDVILQLDGKPMGTFDDVLEILATREPGESVVADLNRFGELLSVPIKLGKPY